MRSFNPANGEFLLEYHEHGADDIATALQLSLETFGRWKETAFEERSALMKAAARALREKSSKYAKLMTDEMGKVIAASEAEVEKCAWVCDFYASEAASFLGEERVRTDADESYIRFDPIGPILAVMPWNFPFWQVFRFAAPALMAGNTALLKHASNVPGCALAIEEVFADAGFPKGAFQTLMIPSRTVEDVIRHPAVKAVTLTGSEPAGASVASCAGRFLKKSVLELGGSDPFIVLQDADLKAAAREATKARCINAGQSCIAAKRFIVEEPVADFFEGLFADSMGSVKVGDPMDRGNDMGPLAREDLREDIHSQVKRSISAGAKLVTGGNRVDGKGFYYEPTVLTGVAPGMPAFDEETFGPVGAVIRAKDPAHAVALANLSEFGLGASLWTSDMEKAKGMAREIDSGSVFVNGMVKSDPRLPFGGVKKSGYGRELSAFGIREFVNIKTVWIKS